MGGARRHGPEERQRLDQLEVLVPDGIAAAGHDVPLVRKGVAGEDLDEPVIGLFLGKVQAQLVQAFVIPAGRALRAVELEGHRALRSQDRAVALERPARAVLELDQRADVVLVGHRACRVTGLAAVVVRAGAGDRERPLLDEGLLHGHDPGDRPAHELGHVDGM